MANITDFAKELLFELRFGKTHEGEKFGIGETPLIFVTHSMGGLLAKKAYLLGQNDEHYKPIVGSISAIVFLSTPHRGSNLAEILNRILVATFQSTRKYIKDLTRNSDALEEINEQFRHIAPRLSIWSFYETLPTSIGPKKMMVLEKDSAVLGYPQEISRPLFADHHGVCKYSSPGDANYVSVRNALGTLVEEIERQVGVSADEATDELQTLQRLFSFLFEHEDDINKYNRLRADGTCEWILNENGMADWTSTTEGSHLVWFSAAPAGGKSVLSAYIVTALQQRSLAPQYFFFNFGDQYKRSVANLLRSIAYQFAKENCAFRRGLLDLLKQGLRVDKADAPLLWYKVYENLLFKLEHRRPFFWVIDALDECESPKLLLDLIRTCSSPSVSLRIFIASRKTEPIHMGVAKIARSLRLTKLDNQKLDHNARDIRRLAELEVGHMRGTEDIKNLVIQKITAGAEGNFLWARLVLEEIACCQTASDVQETLDEFPSDMQKLYDRMEHTILELPRSSSRLLAKDLLQWTVGARRPMCLRELSQALEPDFPEILDLRRTISDVCGHFIRVDTSGCVVMIHQTAREFLVQPRETELFIDMRANHEALCIKTLSALLDSGLTSDMVDSGAASHSYLLYSATSWMYHLTASKISSGKLLDVLVRFFDGGAFPLWVHLLSMKGHLDVLTETSKSLASFVALARKDDSKNSLVRRLSDLQHLDQWAVDLTRLVSRFSTSLLKYPRAIYGLVSPFSPENSALHQQPYCSNDKDLCLLGDLDSSWTDHIARISLPEGFEAYKLGCAGQYVAVLGVNGCVMLWDAQTFMELKIVEHGEPVTCMVLNPQGNKLATYGIQTTKVWAIPSGNTMYLATNNMEARAITLSFTNNDTRIIAGFDDRAVRFLDVEQAEIGWRYVHRTLLEEPLSAEAGANSPTCFAFGRDGSYVGVAYHGFPLTVWSLATGERISRRNKAQRATISPDAYTTGWRATRRFVWNPVTDHVIGIYAEGLVFKWHPLTGEYQEAQIYANDVAASSDGKLFLSSTSTGIIKIWDFVDFCVVYQLSSDDLLIGLAFSPDCLRFYDLRCGIDRSINAWEPNSLLRFSDTDDSASDLISDTAISISVGQALEARLEQHEAISALAASPNGELICVGTNDGSVELRSTKGSGTAEIGKLNNFMEVSHLAWSQDSHFMVAADLVGAIMLNQIEITDDSQMAETAKITPLKSPSLDLKGQVIRQLLFSPDSSILLVIAGQSGHVWSLKDASLILPEKFADEKSRRWVSHPTHQELLLGIGPGDVRVIGWQDFLDCSAPVAYQHTLPLTKDNLLKPDFKGTTSENVKAMVTEDRKYVLIQLIFNNSFTGIRQFIIIPLSELESIRAGVNQTDKTLVQSANIPEDIRSQVRIALAILPGDLFVFLDWDSWVNTYRMIEFAHPSTSPGVTSKQRKKQGDVQRHYFIPDDWAMVRSLDLCCMTADGTLIYPRDDKVSMVKANMNRPAFRWDSSHFSAVNSCQH